MPGLKTQTGNVSASRNDSVTITLPDGTAPVSSASPAGGTYSSAQSVTLTCEDNVGGSGCAAIYYTTDGTEPGENSSRYGSPLDISENTTLKFFAEDVTGNSEETHTETYVISDSPSVSADANRPDLTIDGDTSRLKSGKTFYSGTKTISFKGETESMENGYVKIYNRKDLLKTSSIGSDGKWDQDVHIDDSGLAKISFKYFSSSDELLKETGEFKIFIDTEDPKFTDLPKILRKRPGDMIWWKAKDNNEISYYRYYLNGKIKKTTHKYFYLPKCHKPGISLAEGKSI